MTDPSPALASARAAAGALTLLALTVGALSLAGCDDGGGSDTGDGGGDPGQPDAMTRDWGFALVPTGTVGNFHSGKSAPHMGEVVVWDDRVLVANEFDGLTSVRVEADGSLTLGTAYTTEVVARATTVAVHGASGRAFGAAPDTQDPSEPDDPTVVDQWDARVFDGVVVEAQGTATAIGAAASLHVVGDVLWIGTLGDGLEARGIDPASGGLAFDSRRALAGEHVATVRGVGTDRLVASALRRGVVLLDVGADGGADPSVLDEVAPVGALLDVDGLGAEGTAPAMVAAALGSAGVQVWPLDGGAAPEGFGAPWTLAPPGAAQAVALTRAPAGGATWLAVTAANGLWVYALGETPADGATLLGFMPSRYTMLDVAWQAPMTPDGAPAVIVSDWELVRRFEVQPGAPVGPPDVHRVTVVSPGEDAVVAMRLPDEPGATPGTSRTVRLWAEIGETLLAEAELMPGERGAVTIPAAALDPMVGETDDRGMQVPFWTEVVGLGVAGLPRATPNPTAERGWSDRVLVAAPSPDGATWKRPAPGALMVDVVVHDEVELTPVTVPTVGQGGRLAFWGNDCTAVWPMVRDITRSQELGLLDASRPWLAVDDEPGRTDDFVARWRLPEDTVATAFEGMALAGPDAQVFGEFIGWSVFDLEGFPGMAAHPTSYTWGPDGVVEHVSRVYRGAHGWDVPE